MENQGLMKDVVASLRGKEKDKKKAYVNVNSVDSVIPAENRIEHRPSQYLHYHKALPIPSTTSSATVSSLIRNKNSIENLAEGMHVHLF